MKDMIEDFEKFVEEQRNFHKKEEVINPEWDVLPILYLVWNLKFRD